MKKGIGKLREIVRKFVENERFIVFILLVIIINTVALGLSVTNFFDSAQAAMILAVISKICISIYVIEAVLEIFAWRLTYFENGWNVFDFIIVIISLIPNAGIFSGIRFFRIFKIFRAFTAFRLISNFGQFRKIVEVMIKSLREIIWTIILMVSIYYIFAIIGIYLFQDDFPGFFGSFSVAFVTLFSLTTMEAWQDTVYPIVEVMPLAWIYFISFFIIAAFVLLNVIFGIVVDNIAEENNKDNKQILEKMAKIENKLNHILREMKK